MKYSYKKNYNIQKNEQHPFHMVDSSRWPLMTSFSLLGLGLFFQIFLFQNCFKIIFQI
jgi:hypothetical protein